VVKDAILKEHPWVARSLSDAFQRAKAEWLVRLKRGLGQTADDVKYRKLMSIIGDDPLPYGLAENARTIEALEDTAYKQGLIPRRMSIAELFLDPKAS
jgi:4,5-dihydroxyphthalate decarboxylase